MTWLCKYITVFIAELWGEIPKCHELATYRAALALDRARANKRKTS